MNDLGWSCLPDHIVLFILKHLPLGDQYNAASVCETWNRCFTSPLMWRKFKFQFIKASDARFMKCVDKYGQHLKVVNIEVDQGDTVNRESACYVINKLSQLKRRKLTDLQIKFVGENPLFYAGVEFITALKELFGPIKNGCILENQLTSVNLNGLPVSFDDTLLNELSENHRFVETLHIQNLSLICKVTPVCLLRFVQRCRRVRELSVFKCSLSEDVVLALIEADRKPLQKLSIFCRREEKYNSDISTEIWKVVAEKLPDLRVTLRFDHTCPLSKVAVVMDPHIRVDTLRLETFTYIYDEVNLAASYYRDTLEKVILQTRNSAELNKALINLAQSCLKLKSLHVFCVLEKETIEKILALHPDMRESGTYTLKSVLEGHPWTAGKDCFT